MSGPITLVWKGETHTIPPRRVMECILAVEDIITLGQLARASQANDPPVGRLARAYATVLRMLGVTVEDHEVYRAMFGPDLAMTPLATINTLLTLLVPPEAIAARGTSEGNSPGPTTGPTPRSSPRKPSRRRSATSGAVPSSSGA